MKIEHLLNEAYADVSEKKLEKLLSTKFSQAWKHYIETNNGIFRHDNGARGMDLELVAKIASPLKNREAAYALSNLHNEYINNDSQWLAFPKRAVIGASHVDIVRRRGSPSGVYLILPVNDTPIGLCPKHDIWASFENVNKIMKTGPDVQSLNTFYSTILFDFSEAMTNVLDVDFDAWIKGSGGSYERYREQMNDVDNLLDALKEKEYLEVAEYYDLDPKSIQTNIHTVRCVLGYDYVPEILGRQLDGFCELVKEHGLTYTMDKIFSPKDFRVGTVEEILTDANNDNEVWFNSAYLMIPYAHLKDFYYRYKDI
jgi:hypothetical protein